MLWAVSRQQLPRLCLSCSHPALEQALPGQTTHDNWPLQGGKGAATGPWGTAPMGPICSGAPVGSAEACSTYSALQLDTSSANCLFSFLTSMIPNKYPVHQSLLRWLLLENSTWNIKWTRQDSHSNRAPFWSFTRYFIKTSSASKAGIIILFSYGNWGQAG